MITDPIADGLTKIRNAARAKHPSVDLKPSRQMERVLQVLKDEGFIRTFSGAGDTPATRMFRVYLKYVKKMPAINEVIRMSKPGVRVYKKSAELPRVLGGLGIAVVSTSKGVMTERDAYRQRLGGELMCYVW